MKPPYIPKEPPPDEINSSDLGGNKTLINGLAMLVVVVLSLWSISQFIPGALVSITPEYVETKIGAALSKHPLLKGDTESKRLNGILEKFKETTPEVNIKSISESPQSMENAFATIDHKILVTTSLIKNSSSDIALAFVIGHEAGHIKHKHPLKSFYQNFLIQFIMSFLSGGDSVLKLSGQLASTSFSRAQETEADLYGLNLVHKTYGSIDGAFDFFNRMKTHDKAISLTTGSFLSTHPLSKDRIDKLTEYAKKMGWNTPLK